MRKIPERNRKIASKNKLWTMTDTISWNALAIPELLHVSSQSSCVTATRLVKQRALRCCCFHSDHLLLIRYSFQSLLFQLPGCLDFVFIFLFELHEICSNWSAFYLPVSHMPMQVSFCYAGSAVTENLPDWLLGGCRRPAGDCQDNQMLMRPTWTI